MNRKKKEQKKVKISIAIDEKSFETLDILNINKSKLINWLLNEHFNFIRKEEIL